MLCGACLLTIAESFFENRTMRKLLAIFVFALMTEAITAQPYTFHGKQYDWKWEAPEYTFVPVMGEEDAATLGVELTSMIKAVSSSQIKSPLTLYLSKQGDVTMTVKKGNYGFRAVKSSLLLNGISGLQLQAEPVSEGNICIYRKGRIVAVIKGYGEVYIEGFADQNKQVIQWFKDHPDALNTTASVQSQEESRPQEEITDEDITGDDGSRWIRRWHKRADGIFLGIVDENGKEIVPAKYTYVAYEYNTRGGRFFKAVAPDRSVAVYTRKGRCVIPESKGYRRAEFCNFQNLVAWDVALIDGDGKESHGLLDACGRQIIQPQEKYDGFYLIAGFEYGSFRTDTRYAAIGISCTDNHVRHRLVADASGKILGEYYNGIETEISGVVNDNSLLKVTHDGTVSSFPLKPIASTEFSFEAYDELYLPRPASDVKAEILTPEEIVSRKKLMSVEVKDRKEKDGFEWKYEILHYDGDNLYGAKDTQGNVIIPTIYKWDIEYVQPKWNQSSGHHYFIAHVNGQEIAYTRRGTQITATEDGYHGVRPEGGSSFLAWRVSKRLNDGDKIVSSKGVLDARGKVVILPDSCYQDISLTYARDSKTPDAAPRGFFVANLKGYPNRFIVFSDDGTEIFRGEHGSIFNNPVTLNIRKGNTLEIIYGSNKQKVKIALPPPTTRYSYDVFDDLYY